MKSVLIYCGARVGNLPDYKEAAQLMARTLARRHLNIVYGGGGIGIMGAIADAALEEGGHVTGVIPHFLNEMEEHHGQLSKIHRVETMHERKALMADLADAVIALPGGYGTLDELFEILTWGQLELHSKPIGLLNVNGYYTHLVAHIDQMVETGFVTEHNRGLLKVAETPAELLSLMGL